jgi:hypothetical protein
MNEVNHMAEAKQSLHSPDQLPEIEGDSLIFVWDQEEAESLFWYGGLLVWQVWTGREVYDRYVEIVEILQMKYGRRLIDVTPTLRSQYALYGDKTQAFFHVQSARQSLGRGGETAV